MLHAYDNLLHLYYSLYELFNYQFSMSLTPGGGAEVRAARPLRFPMPRRGEPGTARRAADRLRRACGGMPKAFRVHAGLT